MDWTNIILTLIGLISGGGIMTLATLKPKKEREELKVAEEAFAIIHKVEEESRADLQRKDDIISEQTKKIDGLMNELAEKRNENTTKGYYMCVNLGCQLRCPALGRGKVYFKNHENEENFGANYLSCEELMSRYKRKVYDWGQKPPKTLEEAKETYENRNNFTEETPT